MNINKVSRYILSMITLILFSVNILQAEDNLDKSLSLQQQIDAQKHELIELGRDIKILEDVLLYPAQKRVSIFLTMDIAELFSLEKVKLLLNDKIVAEHVYSDREVTGFGKGSAQKLFIGSLKSGQYKITAIFIGKGPRGRPYKRGVSKVFTKNSQHKIFEISVQDDERKQQPVFYIRDVS